MDQEALNNLKEIHSKLKIIQDTSQRINESVERQLQTAKENPEVTWRLYFKRLSNKILGR